MGVVLVSNSEGSFGRVMDVTNVREDHVPYVPERGSIWAGLVDEKHVESHHYTYFFETLQSWCPSIVRLDTVLAVKICALERSTSQNKPIGRERHLISSHHDLEIRITKLKLLAFEAKQRDLPILCGVDYFHFAEVIYFSSPMRSRRISSG